MPRTAEEHHQEDQRTNRRTGIEQVPAGQFLCLAINLAGQLAEGNDRTGERDRTDEHAEEDFDLEDGHQRSRGVGQLVCEYGGKSRERVAGGLVHAGNPAEFDLGIVADEHGGEADEGVECRNQLRHLGHLNAARDIVAEHGTAGDHQQDDEPVADIRSKDGRGDGKAHADDAIPDGALGAFLAGKSAE